MSPVSCEVSSTVVPSWRERSLMRSRITALAVGAPRPIVGSSRKRIEGRWSRLATISQRMRSPKLSWRTGRASRGSIAKSFESSARRAL